MELQARDEPCVTNERTVPVHAQDLPSVVDGNRLAGSDLTEHGRDAVAPHEVAHPAHVTQSVAFVVDVRCKELAPQQELLAKRHEERLASGGVRLDGSKAVSRAKIEELARRLADIAWLPINGSERRSSKGGEAKEPDRVRARPRAASIPEGGRLPFRASRRASERDAWSSGAKCRAPGDLAAFARHRTFFI